MHPVFRRFCLVAISASMVATVAAAQSASQASQTPAAKAAQQTPGVSTEPAKPKAPQYPPALVENGAGLFQQNCAFCHGRNATGGETGPDLTRSKVVADDVNGSAIAPVIRNGRPQAGMPSFNFSETDIHALVAFIHTQKIKVENNKGGRRGVDVSDLQTGNVEAGKEYFNGAGQCSSCHSPTGDLAGIASRYKGLRLEMRMLYPRKAKSKVTVTPPSSEPVTGELAYLDEFTVGLTDDSGHYHSWPVSKVTYKVDAPVEKHAELLGKYTDDDIHNLMAYLQTLR
jgi:cytochrome c oxidase cbb3-type subunit 3